MKPDCLQNLVSDTRLHLVLDCVTVDIPGFLKAHMLVYIGLFHFVYSPQTPVRYVKLNEMHLGQDHPVNIMAE